MLYSSRNPAIGGARGYCAGVPVSIMLCPMRQADFEEFRVSQALRAAEERKGRIGPAWNFTSSACLRHAGAGTWWERTAVVLGLVLLVVILLDIPLRFL